LVVGAEGLGTSKGLCVCLVMACEVEVFEVLIRTFLAVPQLVNINPKRMQISPKARPLFGPNVD